MFPSPCEVRSECCRGCFVQEWLWSPWEVFPECSRRLLGVFVERSLSAVGVGLESLWSASGVL